MTVSKITSPITPNELIDKTNEIIDNLGSGGAITVDNTLSTTSTNPVQNKVITEALDAKQDNLTAGTDLEIVTESGEAITISGNGSVTLNNAEANSLNYVKLFGTCIQNSTPTPTNPVDIICNNGTLTLDSATQQIIATGITETVKDSLDNTAIAQNLLSISDAEDSSIIYKDEQDILTGNITRRVGFYALTGEETFYYLSSEHLFYSSSALRDENPLGAVNCLCNYYRGKKTSKNRQVGDCYILTSGRLDFLDDRFNSTISFKSWLAERYAAGDPVIVVFPLATPTTETVSGQVLNTTEGINTLSIVQSSIPNLGMEVNYNERNKHIINFTNDSGYITNIDNTTITKNTDNALQTVAVIDNNGGSAIKTWTGTKTQYDAIVTKDSNTLYNITDDTDVTLTLLELLFPVGAVYLGTMSTCPLQTLGVGTWQALPSDKVIQIAGTRGSVNTTLNESLPNVRANGSAILYAENNILNTSEAFKDSLCYTSDVTIAQFTGSSSTGFKNSNLNFNANNSNNTYQDNAPVQPEAYLLNGWRRIA